MDKQPCQRAQIDDMKVMIVLGSDCGLLAEAMYFLSDQKLREQALLLLPARLAGLNLDELDVATERYSSLNDIIELIDQNPPDIVFLCSGYLLVQQNLLPESDFKRFIKYAQQKGCKVITSDPFAGIMSTAVISSAAGVSEIDPDKNYSQLEAYVLSLFIDTYQSLKHLPHIYLWACDDIAPDYHSSLSYYNPKPLGCHKTLASQAILQSYLGDSFSKAYWLFTIGPEDYKIECEQLGLDRLVALTVEKIRWILDSGCHVVLIFPDEFLQSLQDVLPDLKGISMFSYLPYEAFYTLNLNAEYTFYWNVTSASAMIRILHGLPTFHFSIGHIGDSLPHVYEEVVRLFFSNCKPILIDQTKPFDLLTFKQLDEQASVNIAKILKPLESLPTSEALIARLRNG